MNLNVTYRAERLQSHNLMGNIQFTVDDFLLKGGRFINVPAWVGGLGKPPLQIFSSPAWGGVPVPRELFLH